MKPLYLIRWREKAKEEPEVSFVRGHAGLIQELDRLRSATWSLEPPEEIEIYELNRHTMQTLKVPEPQVVFRA